MSPVRSRTESRPAVGRSIYPNPPGSRCLDLLGATVGLLLLSPTLVILAIIIKLTSPGPALFRSIRIGQNARPFALYKFRSMITEAPELGPAITSAADPRITTVGRVMRRLKLDELPQLLNVLQGSMSLVGPRPEDPRYVALYSREQLAVLEAKPGMTSPASLSYRDEESQLTGEDWHDHYVGEVMLAKLAIDGEYLSRRTVWSDVAVVIDTIRTLIVHPSRPQ